MSRSFLETGFALPEVSARLAFGGNTLDRLSENRDETTLAIALAHPEARVLAMAAGRALLSFEGKEAAALHTVEAVHPFQPRSERAVLLGYEGDAPRLAMPLKLDPAAEGFSLPEGWALVDYRSLALQDLLSHAHLGMVAQGAALLAWHGTNRFCARCGGATEPRHAGAKRQCTQCEREQFPRTDPVVIMLTVSGDKCLLGRSHHFPPGMYSALAGFVEAGESMENAVRRETFEEAGLHIGAVYYHATQPWPFPHTLMIGCYAQALDETIHRDEEELDDCRWFTREEVAAILAGEGPRNEDGAPRFFMPPRLAIANRLVTDWVEGRAPL